MKRFGIFNFSLAAPRFIASADRNTGSAATVTVISGTDIVVDYYNYNMNISWKRRRTIGRDDANAGDLLSRL